MPNYLYRCRKCETEWEKFNHIADRKRSGSCPGCGHRRGYIAPAPFSNLTFRKRWFEGIDSQPVFVESQKQLNAICEKNGCAVVKDDRKKQKAYYERRGMIEEGKRLCKGG